MNAIKRLFERRVYRTTAVAIVVLGILVTVIVATKSYAVAEVNGTAIPVSQFKVNYAAARQYYETVQTEYKKNNIESKDISDPELRAGILYELIERQIIDQALRNEAGNETDELVANRIKEYAGDKSLSNAAKELYGFTSADFTREVLIPQAKTDILRGRLFLKNQDFNAWLTEAKKSANVKIFSGDYSWNGVIVSVQ